MSLRLVWRPVLKLFLGLGLGLALGGMFWACAQGEGERCERDEDCQAGLRCAKSANSIAGRCTSGSTIVTPDAMEPSRDAAVDQAAPMDVPAIDVSVPADVTVPVDLPAPVEPGPDMALTGG